MAKIAGIAGTDEAKRLQSAAAGAQAAAERAVNAKNYADAAKQTRLASELGRTLVAVAMIDHAADVRAALPRGGWGMGHRRPGMTGRPGMGPGGMRPGMPGMMPGGQGMPGRAGMMPGPGGPDETADVDDADDDGTAAR
jgi:hypothetical protein